MYIYIHFVYENSYTIFKRIYKCSFFNATFVNGKAIVISFRYSVDTVNDRGERGGERFDVDRGEAERIGDATSSRHRADFRPRCVHRLALRKRICRRRAAADQLTQEASVGTQLRASFTTAMRLERCQRRSCTHARTWHDRPDVGRRTMMPFSRRDAPCRLNVRATSIENLEGIPPSHKDLFTLFSSILLLQTFPSVIRSYTSRLLVRYIHIYLYFIHIYFYILYFIHLKENSRDCSSKFSFLFSKVEQQLYINFASFAQHYYIF